MGLPRPKLRLAWKRKGRTYYAEVGDRTICVERMPFADTLAYSWSGFGNLVSHKWVAAGSTPAETKRHAEAAWFRENPEPHFAEVPQPPKARKRGRPSLGDAKKSNAERSRAKRNRRQAEVLAAIKEREDALVLAVRLLAEFSAFAGAAFRQAFLDGGNGRRENEISELTASMERLGKTDSVKELASTF